MKITWLGHATFLFEFSDGNTLLLDPWIQDNPASPKDFQLKRVNAIALTHGHKDHVGDVISIAGKFSPKVVAIFELAGILEKKGVVNTVGMGKGGTVDLGFAQLTAVNAFHSSSFEDGDNVLYAGEPAGFILQSPGAPVIYCAGDTCLFGDMALIAELYKPEIAILPVGGHYTMGPHEAAHAARLLKVKQVIPMHYGTFPVLVGKPEEVATRVKKDGIEVVVLKPGKRGVGKTMINIRPELEQALEKMAHESGRTLHDLVNDVLAGYVSEVSDLESLRGEPADDAKATQPEFVYVRRRDTGRP